MIVYRIEHPKTKLGPWRHRELEREMYDTLMDTLQHTSNARYTPLFQLMKTFDIPANVKCGCPSLETLFDWFPKTAREILRKEGFKLIALSIKTAVAQSDNQVAFNRDDAIMLSSKPLR